jgi:hypothetical protein
MKNKIEGEIIMKMIKPLNLQNEAVETVPTSRFETLLVRRKSFNEGWWKGFTCSAIASTAGIIAGLIIKKKL